MNARETSFLDHNAWFVAALDDPQRTIRILELSGRPTGYVRLDELSDTEARVNICVSPEARGEGLSYGLLADADRLALDRNISHLFAEIHPDNIPSLRCFQGSGYVQKEIMDGFLVLSKEIRRLQ